MKHLDKFPEAPLLGHSSTEQEVEQLKSVKECCQWCGKLDSRQKLKERAVTPVVGRPRQEWTAKGLPLLYTCCCCYEERRKGRSLDHKMETLHAQYAAFERYGIQFFECKKRVDNSWIQWIATTQEVWHELYYAYYVEQSFEGIKAAPILDIYTSHTQEDRSRVTSNEYDANELYQPPQAILAEFDAPLYDLDISHHDEVDWLVAEALIDLQSTSNCS